MAIRGIMDIKDKDIDMPNFNYTAGLPNPPNLPSQDVNDMQINTNSINSILPVDHFGFNDNDGGYHSQVSMPNEVVPALPSFSKASQGGMLLSHNPTSPNTAPGYPWWLNSVGDFQLSGCGVIAAPVPGTFGYTFLPGGMLIQWGIQTASIAAGTVTFATMGIDFPNACFNVQTNLAGINPTLASNVAITSVLSTTGFNYKTTVPAGYTGFWWVAIGN